MLVRGGANNIKHKQHLPGPITGRKMGSTTGTSSTSDVNVFSMISARTCGFDNVLGDAVTVCVVGQQHTDQCKDKRRIMHVWYKQAIRSHTPPHPAQPTLCGCDAASDSATAPPSDLP